jgi:hypothetical protein
MRKCRSLPFFLLFLLILAGASTAPAADEGKRFSAELLGIGGSQASGKATFELNKEGTSLHYRLVVSNAQDVTMAHIHIGPPNKDGPVAAWLYPSSPPPMLKPGKFEGTLAEGDIKASSLQGDLAGKPLSDLIGKIEGGEAYVNVHTQKNPGGEFRGQIHK